MGSKAPPHATLPGPPTATELAFLAGLLERAGGFTAARPSMIGLKITAPAALQNWLLRFGGYHHDRCWLLTRQADVAFLLPRLRPYLVTRTAECEAMEALIAHLRGRTAYHGDPAWRGERARLMGLVRALR